MTLVQRRPSSEASSGLDASLIESVLARAAARADALGRPVLASISISIEHIDPVGLFAAGYGQGLAPALWYQRDSGVALVGIGETWAVEAEGTGRFEQVRSAWDALVAEAAIDVPQGVDSVGPSLLGGFGFSDETCLSKTWSGFERARFSLPAALFSHTTEGSACLSLNEMVAPGTRTAERAAKAKVEGWRSVVAHVRVRGGGSDAVPELRIAAMRPGKPAWQASVARFAGAVGRGRLDKAVLTRQLDLVADHAIDVPRVLDQLVDSAPESTVFAFTRGHRTFLGATPERLIRARGRRISTVAMAGSTPRGRDAHEDDELAQRLLTSDKEREEHAVVVQMLRRTLTPLTSTLDIAPRPEVVALRHVQHLVTAIEGDVAEPVSILELVGQLHPTPAVGGTPTDLALELIADEERHERGWYAGPIGWVDAAGDGEFAVALRSGVVAGDTATLLAGCGIVADSDPEREWAESLVKLQALGSALGHVAS